MSVEDFERWADEEIERERNPPPPYVRRARRRLRTLDLIIIAGACVLIGAPWYWALVVAAAAYAFVERIPK